jgi:hypothetical protein
VLVLITSYLLLVFALPVALSIMVSYRSLPRGRDCPHCRGDTIQLLAPRLRAASALSPAAALERRWCLCCGWEGTVRVKRERITPRPMQPPPPARVPRQPVRERPHPARTTQTLNVRCMDVDGAAWRVMLQCWSSTGLYYGRFIFVGPSGRLWLDSVEAFSGASENEVLGHALSLPENTLASRLRRLVSD